MLAPGDCRLILELISNGIEHQSKILDGVKTSPSQNRESICRREELLKDFDRLRQVMRAELRERRLKRDVSATAEIDRPPESSL
jgi:hypothetical protein